MNNETKAEAFRRIRNHLDYNQAYSEIAWQDATLRRVSKADKQRYIRLAATLEQNIQELRRMYSSENYSTEELRIIQMVANDNKKYLEIVLEHVKVIELLEKQNPLFK